jgi:hypothetical protein
MEILDVSCTTGAGLDDWMKWLEKKRNASMAAVSS